MLFCGDLDLIGKLAYGTPVPEPSTQTQPLSFLNEGLRDCRIRQVALGDGFGVALSMTGEAFTFGRFGPLGRLVVEDHPPYLNQWPARLHGAPPSIRQVAAGRTFGLCLDARGDVYMWGEFRPFYAVLRAFHGDGTIVRGENETAVQVPGLKRVTDLFSAPFANYFLALAEDGTLYSSGAYITRIKTTMTKLEKVSYVLRSVSAFRGPRKWRAREGDPRRFGAVRVWGSGPR